MCINATLLATDQLLLIRCDRGGTFICTGPCFVNNTERDELKMFGAGHKFLNYSIHNTKTAFTENEVYTSHSRSKYWSQVIFYEI